MGTFGDIISHHWGARWELFERLKGILGLTQENFSIDQAVYDPDNNLIQSRIRIYSDSLSVGTNNNVVATYLMEATYDEPCKMSSYKVVKQ